MCDDYIIYINGFDSNKAQEIIDTDVIQLSDACYDKIIYLGINEINDKVKFIRYDDNYNIETNDIFEMDIIIDEKYFEFINIYKQLKRTKGNMVLIYISHIKYQLLELISDFLENTSEWEYSVLEE